jgi:hypothetical protein
LVSRCIWQAVGFYFDFPLQMAGFCVLRRFHIEGGRLLCFTLISHCRWQAFVFYVDFILKVAGCCVLQYFNFPLQMAGCCVLH